MGGKMEYTENTAINDKHHPGGVFVPGDVLKDFDVNVLNNETCKMWITERLHRNEVRCPRCGASLPGRLMYSFWDCKRIKCDKCGKYFTALTGTFLSGCHFSFREIFLLSFLLALGVPDKQIAATLKISAENVRLWKAKFKSLENGVLSNAR